MRLPPLYPILDTETVRRRGLRTLAAAAAVLEAGAGILQYRHKGFLSRDVLAEIEQVAVLCRSAGVPLVMNDRADVAVLAGAGLHLGQDDLPPSAARRVTGSQTLIGFSTHNERQLHAALAEPVDYLALGPIFGTASKENPDPVVGIEELRRLAPLADRPLVAIGGITRENARSVLEAGANSVAVIGDLFPQDGSVRTRVEEWLRLLRS